MTAPARPTSYALPAFLAEIARATSIEVAIAIARVHGGRRLYLPDGSRSRTGTIERGHPLARLVGTKEARIICARWGGDTYDVPSASAYLHWWDARRLKAERKSNSEISKRLGISQNHVRKLLEGFAAPDGPAPAHEPLGSRAVCPLCLRRHRPARPAREPGDPRQLALAL